MGLNLTEIDSHLQSLEKKELVYLYIMIVGGAFFAMNKLTKNLNTWEDYANGY